MRGGYRYWRSTGSVAPSRTPCEVYVYRHWCSAGSVGAPSCPAHGTSALKRGCGTHRTSPRSPSSTFLFFGKAMHGFHTCHYARRLQLPHTADDPLSPSPLPTIDCPVVITVRVYDHADVFQNRESVIENRDSKIKNRGSRSRFWGSTQAGQA